MIVASLCVIGAALTALPYAAYSQNNNCQAYLTYKAVLTPAQWQYCLSLKQDVYPNSGIPLSNTLPPGQVFVGNASSVAVPTPLTGAIGSISSSGAVTLATGVTLPSPVVTGTLNIPGGGAWSASSLIVPSVAVFDYGTQSLAVVGAFSVGSPTGGLPANGINATGYEANGTAGVTKTCTTYPTVVSGIVTSC